MHITHTHSAYGVHIHTYKTRQDNVDTVPPPPPHGEGRFPRDADLDRVPDDQGALAVLQPRQVADDVCAWADAP